MPSKLSDFADAARYFFPSGSGSSIVDLIEGIVRDVLLGPYGLLSNILAWFGVTVALDMTADLEEGTASITSGTTALTVSGIALAAGHVGKTVVVKGAGGTDVPLLTTISAVTSGTTATVALAASATVSGALCSVGTNNATALQASLTAAAGGTLVIPPGSYLVAANVGTVASDGAIATVPSNTTVLGFPRKSRLHHLGSDNNNSGYFNALLRVEDGSTGVRFFGLHFTSDNTSAFSYVFNCQATAIDIWLTTTRDVWVVGCTFDDLWGFSVHDRGNNERVHACLNVCRNCANGLNVNSDYSLQFGNWFENSEGIEASGKGAVIALNVVKDGRGVGISAGGDLTAGAQKPQVIAANLIDGVAGGVGIITAQSSAGTLVVGNVVRRADAGGIQISGSGGGGVLAQWVALVGNVVFQNCIDPGGNLVGIAVASGGTGPHFVVGNIAFDGGLSGYKQKYGLTAATAGTFIAANYLSGLDVDLQVQATATGCTVVANALPNYTTQMQVALAPETRVANAAGDTLIVEYIYGETPSSGYGRHARLGSGQLEWGSGSANRDTNLYRAAADQLKTDDRLIAALGVVTNTGATGSRPGSPTTGQMYLDTTLHKLIIWDGAAWRDGAGTSV